MKNYLLLTALLFTFFSCDFNKSVNKDLITGLTSKGDGISCEKVYLSDGQREIKKSEFIYGEKFYFNFKNLKGFTKEGSLVFPGLEMVVVNMEKDTVLHELDLFKDQPGGLDINPLDLNANLVVANPVHSNMEYVVFINIWDKKGSGTFNSKMKFNVVSNEKLTVESTNMIYDEIYLFSETSGNAITDNNVKVGDKVYMICEGIDKFYEEDGRAYLGISINAKDSKGNTILDTGNLLQDIAYDATELKKRVTASVVFTPGGINNPIHCEFLFWDKKSESKIKVSTELYLE